VQIEIRDVSGIDELERWIAVHNAVRPDDPANLEQKVLIRAEELEHVDLLAYVDGEPAGVAKLSGDSESVRSGCPWIDVCVLPERRRRGIGSALLEAISAQARRQGNVALAGEARAEDVESIGFLERRGFVESGRFERLELDLGPNGAADGAAPPGVELTWLADRPALLTGMYEVAAATYPELGGYIGRQAETLVQWQVYELGSGAALLALTPLALAGGRVVGFATIKGVDELTAELRMVCVLPEWRGRGVAGALLEAQLAAARRAGLRRAVTWVRGGQPVGLYRRLRMRPGAAAIEFRAALA
jgi:GNAT superfamily N-acetyltransferase